MQVLIMSIFFNSELQFKDTETEIKSKPRELN